jgi:dihydroorotate dehydrogenase electron transfer subunit
MAVIREITEPAENFRTYIFDYAEPCQPGQFLMIWLPRINEKPFTISMTAPGKIGITVQQVGDFTKELFKLRVGDQFGVRGPYGNGYRIASPDNACVVTGGSGSAAIMPLIRSLNDPLIIIGARTKNLLLYREALKQAHFVTDDGSYGTRGFVTDKLVELLASSPVKTVYTCGPEKMLKAVIDICVKNNVDCQFSLERYMKCGIGVCGQCTCGKKRVCAEGPVFSIEDLPDLTEFGQFKRSKTGGRDTI